MSSAEFGLKGTVRELLRYKGAVLGLAIIIVLVSISIYAVVAIPYDKAVEQWRESEYWIKNPKNAAPEWINYFSDKKLPKSIYLSGEGKVVKDGGRSELVFEYSFEYYYDDFPSEIILFVNSNVTKPFYLKASLLRPDGDLIFLGKYRIKKGENRIYITNKLDLEASLEKHVEERLGAKPNFSITIEKALFLAYTGKQEVLKGGYKVKLEALTNATSKDVSCEVVIYGKVHGLTGTDHLRRPLSIALIWGTPVALSFGITAATLIVLMQLIIATISAWFGGRVDMVLQRVTEVYMVLPFLPTLIMISLFYRISIWTLLLVVIALSVFGANVKTMRALAMQIKTYPYIEAAQAYGASSLRIVFLYMIPKMLPPVIPSIILSVPDFVFLEAVLSFFGLGDPLLPTWGKLLHDALENGALYKGLYYWVLEPSALLVLTAFSFAQIGLALDKIVNPRLREI